MGRPGAKRRGPVPLRSAARARAAATAWNRGGASPLERGVATNWVSRGDGRLVQAQGSVTVRVAPIGLWIVALGAGVGAIALRSYRTSAGTSPPQSSTATNK